jgi:hypothetical protein
MEGIGEGAGGRELTRANLHPLNDVRTQTYAAELQNLRKKSNCQTKPNKSSIIPNTSRTSTAKTTQPHSQPCHKVLVRLCGDGRPEAPRPRLIRGGGGVHMMPTTSPLADTQNPTKPGGAGTGPWSRLRNGNGSHIDKEGPGSSMVPSHKCSSVPHPPWSQMVPRPGSQMVPGS